MGKLKDVLVYPCFVNKLRKLSVTFFGDKKNVTQILYRFQVKKHICVKNHHIQMKTRISRSHPTNKNNIIGIF